MEQYAEIMRQKERDRKSGDIFNNQLAQTISNPSIKNITDSAMALAKTIGDNGNKELRDDIDNYIYVEKRIKRYF